MRVLLIQPGLPKGLKTVPQCAPPIGLMYLAAYLRANRPSDQIRILDMQVNRLDPEAARAEAGRFDPQVVGITSMSLFAPTMHATAAAVKAVAPNAAVIIGGPHSMAAPEIILKDKNIDAACMGEGERTLLEYVNALETGSPLEKVPGLSIRDGSGGVKSTPVRPYIEDVDSIPLPARDLIDLDKFFDFDVLTQNDMRANRNYTTIFTSRACPYRCIFCHNIFGKKFRARSPSSVLDEMEMLFRDYAIREFHVIDDCFNLDVDRAAEIMQGILDRGMKVHIAFPNGIRADRLPDNLLDLMRRAGVYKMNIGIESGNARIQKLIRKNLDLNVLRDAVERADRKGIITHGFFMLGFPGETEEEMLETIEFACSSRLMMAGFFFVNPYPNTELYRIAMEMGRCPHYEGYEGCFFDAGINLSQVSDKRLEELNRAAYRRFYLNPMRIAKTAWRIPRKSDLLRALKAHAMVKFV